MALEKKTVLDSIEIKSDGYVFIKLIKRIVDGDAVYLNEPHRSGFDPTTSITEQVELINSHLDQMGFPAISVNDVKRFESHAKIARTPEAVAGFKANRDQQVKILSAARSKA